MSDLGGLGGKEGPALAYTWTMPSMMPEVLPWMLLLLLLALQPNRKLSAWLICLPLGTICAVVPLLESAELMRGAFDVFRQVFGSLAFALTAVWLLSPYLVRKYRLLTCLSFMLTLGIASALFYGIRELWDNDWAVDSVGIIVSIFVLGFGLSLAMALSGLVCRRRYRPVRFFLFTVIWMFLGITACLCPIVLGMTLLNNWPTSPMQVITELLTGVLIAVGGNMLVLLPYLLLSFGNSFYRERFRALFHLSEPTAPPVAPPPLETPAQAAP